MCFFDIHTTYGRRTSDKAVLNASIEFLNDEEEKKNVYWKNRLAKIHEFEMYSIHSTKY